MAASHLLITLGEAVAVFVSTNIDDIVLLSVLFADRELRPRSVVIGQHLGMAVLVLVSALAGAAAVAIPPGWTSLLGVLPLALGVAKAVALVRAHGAVTDDDDDDGAKKIATASSQILAVTGVTLANGGDNLSVYIPIFAADRHAIGIYSAVFLVLTALLCAGGYRLVNNRLFGAKLQRYGHVVLPVVLIALGVHLLAGARVLL